MSEQGRERLLFALLLLVLVGAWASRTYNQTVGARQDALLDYEERVQALLAGGDSLGAVQALNRANEADPERALERGLVFLQSWRGAGASLASGITALAPPESLAALPDWTPAPTQPLAGGALPGPSPVVVLGERAGPLVETWALQGAPMASTDPSAVTGTSSLVVTDALASIPAAARALHTLPDGDPLGLGPGVDLALTGCHLASSSLLPVSRLGVRAPFDGALRAWAVLPDDVEVLAQVECPGAPPRPAVLRRGTTTMLVFDGVRLLLRWRQGDPAVAGQEIDGVPGPRPSDLFPRRLSSVDLVAPFADLWMAALLRLAEEPGPSLRLWPHPPGSRSTLVVTSDQDFADDGTLRAMLVALGRVQVRPTVFLTSGGIQPDVLPRLTDPSPPALRDAQRAGVDFGAHPVVPRWDPSADLLANLTSQRGALERGYGLSPTSLRTHKLDWDGYLEPAERAAAAGYTWDASWMTVVSTNVASMGYMTGSGLPLRFTRPDGSPIGLRQLTTQLDDAANPATGTSAQSGLPKLPRGKFLFRTQEILRSSAARFHSNVAINNHPDHFLRDSEWLFGLIAAARSEGVAVSSLAELAAWTDGLLASELRRDGEIWQVRVAHPQQELVVFGHGGEVLVDGAVAPTREERRFDEPVLVLVLPRGDHSVQLRGPARPVEPLQSAPVAVEAAGDVVTFPLAVPRFFRADTFTTRDLPGLPASRALSHWNGWGVRGDEVDPRREDQVRIVTLGGSVTECLMLSDEDSWPGRLQRSLEEATGRDVWVGNMGVSGQQVIDYTARVRTQLSALRPHLVIVMPGGNDVQAACEDRLLPMDLDQPGVLAQLSARLFPSSEPLELILAETALSPEEIAARARTRSLDLTGMYEVGKAKRSAAAELRPAIRDFDDHLDAYRTNLAELVEALQALDGGEGVLLTHPALWKPSMTPEEVASLWGGYTCLGCAEPAFHSPEALRSALDAFNAETLRQCAERGLTCFDIAPRVQRTLTNFYDDAHLTAAGAQAMSDALAAFILEKELLP